MASTHPRSNQYTVLNFHSANAYIIRFSQLSISSISTSETKLHRHVAVSTRARIIEFQSSSPEQPAKRRSSSAINQLISLRSIVRISKNRLSFFPRSFPEPCPRAMPMGKPNKEHG